jgi:hypothetical protein
LRLPGPSESRVLLEQCPQNEMRAFYIYSWRVNYYENLDDTDCKTARRMTLVGVIIIYRGLRTSSPFSDYIFRRAVKPNEFPAAKEWTMADNTKLPVGTIVYSMLDQNTFQQQIGADETWVLADGSDLAGQNTKYETVTHSSKLPNLLGVFVRGKNNARSDGFQNPDGELALGTLSRDRFAAHSHGGNTGTDSPDHQHGFGGYPFGASYGGDNGAQNLTVHPNGFYRTTDSTTTRHSHAINSEGGLDTAPKSVTLNPFIRIN